MSSPIEPFRVDFSNFYKFVSSVGIVLIAAAVAIPWFVLKAATPDAPSSSGAAIIVEEAVEARADQYLLAIQLYPWISGILLALGVTLTVYGLAAWRKRQKKQDADEDETFRQRRVLGVTQKATDTETEEKLEQEASSSSDSDSGMTRAETSAEGKSVQGLPPLPNSAALASRNELRRRIEISERRVDQLLRDGFSSSHSIEPGVRIPSGDDYAQVPIVDFVARAQDPKRWTSFATEVRLMPTSFGPPVNDWVRRMLIGIAIAARGVPVGPVPRGTVGRPFLARSVSLAVTVVKDASGDLSGPSITSRRPVDWRRLANECRVVNSVLSRPVGVMVITESTLKSISSSEFRDRVVKLLENPNEPYLDARLLDASINR